MKNTSNIQYAPTKYSKNLGPPLDKVLISPSSIREDTMQSPIRQKRQCQESFTNTKS